MSVTLRGQDTRLGEAGYCSWCGIYMDAGPDKCLGTLPHVVEACCGHGVVDAAYVVLEEAVWPTALPGEVAPLNLRGARALRYFKRVGVGP